jgi:hypothetical protein
MTSMTQFQKKISLPTQKPYTQGSIYRIIPDTELNNKL